MGKIGYSSVTLTDLTETLPVTLVLETSLDQNIQTKVGNLYTPNFKEKELIITPSLFLGQEEILFSKHPEYLKPESETDSGYLYYEIGDTVYKWTGNFNSSIYVDDEGKLHIKENLTANTTIEAYIEDFYEPTHNYTVDLVSRVNPIDILFLEEGNDNYYAVIECSGGREHFEDTNANAITMTVKLYQGLINLLDTRLNDFEIKWDKLSDGDNNADSTATQLTVKRSDITNRELFTCEIKDKSTGITYTAQQFIYDFTDQYNCVITYDKPLLLSEENTEVNLSAAVWYKNERLEDKTGYNLSYRWMVVGEKDAEDKNLSGNKSTIKISSNDINIPQKQAFTVLCQVLHTDSAGSQYIIANGVVTFQWIPSYSVRISPKDIFVVTGSDGSYQGNSSKQYTFNFQLIDKQGNLINYDTSDNQSESISAGTNSDGTKITFSNPKNNKWDFTGTITLSNALWNSTDGSRAYEFTYVYYGQQFTEEVNVIKNKTGAQGIQGIQGFSGYTVDLSNEFHAFSGGEGHADPNQSTSCKISAYYGSEGRTIQSIKLGSQIVYQLNTTPSLVTYHSSDYGYLYIQAKKEQDHIIELTIRTNNSTTEAGKFLTRIRPLSFDVTILNTKNESLVFPKKFTYTINYNGKSYSLVPKHNFIKYSEAEGTYDPSSTTVSAIVRQESGESVTYSGAKIIYSFDSDNWKNYTTSGISGYVNLQNIYLRLYSSQATFSSTPTLAEISNNAKYLLDTETIPILTSLEGYQIGGENLLRWTKDLPIENGKWTRTKDSDSYLIVEKDGDFSVLKYFVTDTSTWKNFKSPRVPLEPEYIGEKLCFSCFVYSDDWSTMSSSFHLGISAYKSYNSTGRDAYKNVGIFNNKGESNSNLIQYEGAWENKKWIKIWTVFSFSDLIGTDFDTNEDGVKDEKDKADPVFPHSDYKYYSFDLFLKDKGQLKIKKPKLELGNVPTAWSASPYDIDYTNIAGTNLIDDAKPVLTFSNSYRLNSSLFSKDNLYTLSWSQVSYSGNKPTLTWKINNSSTNTGSFSLINNFQYTFPKQNADWYLTLTVSEGEITFNELKIEKGAIATGYKITVEQANAIAEEQARNAALAEAEAAKNAAISSAEEALKYQVEELYKIPTIGGGYEAFSTKEAFIEAILKYNEYDGRIDTIAGDLKAKDTDILYSKNGVAKLEKSINIVTSETEPYIKIQADLQSNTSSETNFLKLTPTRLEFWSGTTSEQKVVAYMSNKLLVIKQGQLDEAVVKKYFNIGGLNFKITESGVGVVWDLDFEYADE